MASSDASKPEIQLPLVCAQGGCCACCFESSPKLSFCLGCKHVRYCNRDCQKKDWSFHKPLCQFLKLKNQILKSLPSCDDSDSNSRLSHFLLLKKKLVEELKRPLKENEMRLLLHEGKCCVCLTGRRMFSSSHKLEGCQKCHWGWRCAGCHDDFGAGGFHTEQICETFQATNRIDILLATHVRETSELPNFCPDPSPLQKKEDKQLPPNWKSYYTFHKLDQLLPTFLESFTIFMHRPLTTLHALSRFYTPDTMFSLRSLTIHIVGATFQNECPPTCEWEELLHFLPHLETLHIVCIGPEALGGGEEEREREKREGIITKKTDAPISVKLCPECTREGKKRLTSIYVGCYHEFRASKESYCVPELVMLFDPGLGESRGSEREGWMRSIEGIVEDDVPCCVSSFCLDEAQGDSDFMEPFKAGIINDCTPNPFRSLYPKPDFIKKKGDTQEFYYESTFLLDFRGKYSLDRTDPSPIAVESDDDTDSPSVE